MISFTRTAATAIAAIALLGLGACERSVVVATDIDVRQTTQEDPQVYGRVTRVVDGDTLIVRDGYGQVHTLRLAEIDAPERGQPWGNRARQALAAMVADRDVTVQPTDTDRYGRTIARVFVGGEDVSRSMIETGAAWAFRRYLNDETLVSIEAEARRDQRGLWSMSDAQTIAPWDWRRGVREGGASGARTAPFTDVAAPIPSRTTANGPSFSCGEKRFCRQMTSCEEAEFYLEQCHVGSLDGNGDGEPCEALCGTIVSR